MKDDTISRKAAIDEIINLWVEKPFGNPALVEIKDCIEKLPSAQPKSYREGYQAGFKDAQPECAKDFVMLKVIDLNGRPYYSIIYLENGNEFEGYSSYDLKVISEYLKRYFGFAQPERQKGEWIDYTEDGYVECPFCHNATNCDGNKDELHFCFSCGADMREDNHETD